MTGESAAAAAAAALAPSIAGLLQIRDVGVGGGADFTAAAATTKEECNQCRAAMRRRHDHYCARRS